MDATVPAPSRCFVCGSLTDARGEGTGPGRACAECARRARLVRGGALLDALLRSASPPLEGSGWSYILNPLEIDGRRCWADFAAGGVAILQEVRPSADLFDFHVQHVEPWRSLLATLRGVSPFGERRRINVAGIIAQAPPVTPAGDNVSYLASIWEHAHRADEVLAARRPIRSPEDARAVADALFGSETPRDPQSPIRMLERVAALAASMP